MEVEIDDIYAILLLNFENFIGKKLDSGPNKKLELSTSFRDF